MATRNGFISGFSFFDSTSTSHSLFADDMLLFGSLRRNHWFYILFIFNKFAAATGLHINKDKSFLLYEFGDLDEILFIAEFLGVRVQLLTDGLSYLGYKIKPCGYHRVDWLWMLQRFRKKINTWTHRWLSLGNRYIMIQAMLSQLLVYWGHIFYLPANIVEDINRIIGRFLWNGSGDTHKFHLVRLSSLCRSKYHDGWGILDTRNFNIALLIKSFWWATNGLGIWPQIVKCKYLTGDPLHFLLCHEFLFPAS